MRSVGAARTRVEARLHPLSLRKAYGERVLHFMILPGLAATIIFNYLPLYGLVTAFKNYSVFKGIWDSPWARNNGLEHFVDFFKSAQVWQVLRNTVALAFLSLIFVQFPPVAFAMLLNEIRNRLFKRFTQTVSYLPHFVSWVVLGGIMFMLFLPTRSAPVNRILLALNIAKKPTDIMNRAGSIWAVFVVSELWKGIGWHSIIYLAVIASIDPNLFEAIEIDGGGRFAKMLHITWPSLKSTFIILFILKCGRIMSAAGFFDQSYVLGTASNRPMSQVLDVYVLRIGLEQGRYSFAAAVGLLQQSVNVLLLVAANWLSRKVSGKGLY